MLMLRRRLLHTTTAGLMAATEVKTIPIPRRGVDYRGKVVLAPMVRSGELPSRLLALHYGADLVWSPETVDHSMLGATRSVNPTTGVVEWTKLTPKGVRSLMFSTHPEREGRRLIFQVGTSDPDRAVQAARAVAADVAGVDVNAGCPKPFSTSGGMGAALLRDPDKLCAILEALVRNVASEFEIGISVKIRMLQDPADTEALVRRLVATGIVGLTVHCRFPPTRAREPANRGQLRMVADICREAGVACVMNGDVADRDQALELAKEFGVDGAMIATAAEKNPSCFRSGADGGLLPWEEVVERYVDTAMDVQNRFTNTKFMLVQMIAGKKMPKTLHSSKNYAGACDALGLSGLVEKAKMTDAMYAYRREQDHAGAIIRMKPEQAAQATGGGATQPKQNGSKRKFSDLNGSSGQRGTKRPAGKQKQEPPVSALVE